eukprot:CAMPEP_0198353974 /NCGR_PEP_ID=MMETSP1450-20131203/113555_1 /TAXON_ID=753684 ORGANISM="Madagascaria erythrocladiodes, Strain CCMP3234" /NCGR_SAMPLE_ID=MMETSP1450 /ASSEMBLY_ACC=CAM_ASM_001115 /LENGTH=48 /DNA_ID= /DNA_START= /DNA_END= /DNA_ORIENTATION=
MSKKKISGCMRCQIAEHIQTALIGEMTCAYYSNNELGNTKTMNDEMNR